MKLWEWIKANPKKSVGILGAFFAMMTAAGWGFLTPEQRDAVMIFFNFAAAM